MVITGVLRDYNFLLKSVIFKLKQYFVLGEVSTIFPTSQKLIEVSCVVSFKSTLFLVKDCFIPIKSFIVLAEACSEFAGPIPASIRQGNTAPNKTSQRRRAIGNTLSDLTDRDFNIRFKLVFKVILKKGINF